MAIWMAVGVTVTMPAHVLTVAGLVTRGGVLARIGRLAVVVTDRLGVGVFHPVGADVVVEGIVQVLVTIDPDLGHVVGPWICPVEHGVDSVLAADPEEHQAGAAVVLDPKLEQVTVLEGAGNAVRPAVRAGVLVLPPRALKGIGVDSLRVPIVPWVGVRDLAIQLVAVRPAADFSNPRVAGPESDLIVPVVWVRAGDVVRERRHALGGERDVGGAAAMDHLDGKVKRDGVAVVLEVVRETRHVVVGAGKQGMGCVTGGKKEAVNVRGSQLQSTRLVI